MKERPILFSGPMVRDLLKEKDSCSGVIPSRLPRSGHVVERSQYIRPIPVHLRNLIRMKLRGSDLHFRANKVNSFDQSATKISNERELSLALNSLSTPSEPSKNIRDLVVVDNQQIVLFWLYECIAVDEAAYLLAEPCDLRAEKKLSCYLFLGPSRNLLSMLFTSNRNRRDYRAYGANRLEP